MNTTQDDLGFWVAFNLIPDIGPKRFSKLRNHFKDLSDAWNASHSELTAAGLEERVIANILAKRKSINPVHELERLAEQKIKVITLLSEEYPSPLAQITNPPPLLYRKGSKLNTNESIHIAVVGSRKMTPYGSQVIDDIVTRFCHQGIVTVSGLALGTDAQAHRTCVTHPHKTIAVLANGLDRVYPTSHTSLAREILDTGGTIISEYPLGTQSYKSHFPHRNRIISGLCTAVVVIEAARGSGSLITAKHALEQGRDIFAVPGSIYSPESQGTNDLLVQGAIPVTCAEDIAGTLNNESIAVSESRVIVPTSDDEASIITALDFTPKHINDIIKLTKLDVQKINSILVTMEINGIIQNTGGMHYRLVR